MYRFLLKPRWILSHLFVLACVVVMIWAGFWQLSRLSERRAANAEVLSAQTEPIAPIGEVLPNGSDSTADEVAAAQYRAVTVTGTYRPDDQVLIRNRSYEGAPGYWVLTPLVLADGSAVGVNRGWVPFAVLPEGPWDRFAPPTGTVTVTGLLPRAAGEGDGRHRVESRGRGRGAATDAVAGRHRPAAGAGHHPAVPGLRRPADPAAGPARGHAHAGAPARAE